MAIAIQELLRITVEKNASDLHVLAGSPPALRVFGKIEYLAMPELSPEETEAMLNACSTAVQQERLRETKELDFGYSIEKLARFRVNAFYQQGTVSMVFRTIKDQVPTLEELGLPLVLKTLAQKPRGMVLVTGPTGSGKTTTLAALIDLINEERSCNIITLEDPIEYVHKSKRSIVHQREVHLDTFSFANGLRASLREDPDVILVGEMRDLETVSIAITAAETGHLVFGTLHTQDAAQSIDRIIDVFPTSHQNQIKSQLAQILQGIVAQRLMPRKDRPGRIAALEVLVSTPAIKNLVREGKTHQILSAIQTGSSLGMQSMDQVLKDYYNRGLIDFEEALSNATDPDIFLRMVRGSY